MKSGYRVFIFGLVLIVAGTLQTLAQAPAPVLGDYASVATGAWETAGTWLIYSTNNAFDSVATGAPSSSKNVYIQTGTTVTYTASSQNCRNLIIQSGATLQGGVALPSTTFLKINGPVMWVDGTFGSSATDGLSIETKYSTGPITISGSGTINIGQLRPNSSQPDPLAIVFAANATLNYAGSGGTGGSGIYLTGRGLQKTVTVTISSGVTLNFGTNSNFSLTSGNTPYGNMNVTLNVDGTLNIPNGNLTLVDSAVYTCTMNVGGTGLVAVGKNYTPYRSGSGIAVVNVASGGAFNILNGGSADFTNPSATVTGAGSFALQTGATINIGASAGLDAASGPVRTTTATFDTGAKYSYVGTGVQELGALLPDSVNTLTIGVSSIDTVRTAKKVKVKGVLQIDGWLVNSGGLTSSGTGTVSGTYQHNDTAVAMPTATWNTGSMCLVTVLYPAFSGGIPNGSQNFYNYKVDCPTLVGAGRLGMNGNTISGNLIIHNTNDPTGAASNMAALVPKGGPPNDIATVTVLGNLLIDSSAASLSIGYGSTAQRAVLIVYGNIISKGVLYGNGSGISSIFYAYGDINIQNTVSNSFRGHSSATYPDSVVFCGAGVQKFTKPVALTSMSNLRFFVKSGSTLYLDDTTVVTYGSTIGTFAVADGATLKLGHPNGLNGNLSSSVLPALSSNANYEFMGGSAQVSGAWLPLTVNNLTINNSLGVGLDTSCAVNGTLSLASGALSINDNTLTINGSISQTGGSLTGGPTSNLTVGGTGSGITIPGSVGSLNALTLNNPNGATLGGGLTVNGPLTFTAGKLTTSANTLTIGPSGTVSGEGAGKYVNGNLARTYATGPQSFTYTVGDASMYAPVDVSFNNVSTGGTVTAKTTSGDHPNVAASGVDGGKSVNRYWTLTNTDLGFDQFVADLHFDTTEVDAGANSANFYVKKYDAGTWSSPTTGTRTLTSTQATGMTSMSDFVVGELSPPSISVTGTLSDFGLAGVGSSSAEQSYAVAGANLLGDIVITAPTDFEVSATSGTGFGPSVTLTQVGGAVNNTPIYVRFLPGSIGVKSGNISHASTGATPVNKAVSGIGISAQPATQASAVNFTNVNAISMTVNWTNGDGANRIVLAKSGSAVDADPSDTMAYTANAAFGSGSQIGSGNYVVYAGSGNSVNVTGLSIGATYHFAVYEYNGSGSTLNYLVPGAAGSQPTIQLVMLSNGTGGGVWSSGTTWQGGVVPGAIDSAVVRGTDVVSVSSTTMVAGVYVESGATITVSADTLKPTFMAVGGTLSLTGGTVKVAGGAQLNILNGGKADFTNPAAKVTGAGTFALQSGGTIKIGASAGLDAVSGPVLTTTAMFDTGANYSYLGTGVQELGALLPDSMNNLTIGINSIDTVKALKKVKGVLQIDGWLVNNGGLISAGTATVNGTYQHNDSAAAGPMPVATWNTGSTCLVTRLNGTATGGIPSGSQNFYNYVVDCPTLTGSARLGMRDNTIGGNLVIRSTNDPTGAANNYVAITPRGTSPAGGPPTDIATVTVMGDLLIDSSAASLSIGSGSASYPQTGVLVVHGNIISKGVLYGNGSGVSNLFYVYGDILVQSAGSNAFRGHSASAYPDSIVFCGAGVQKFIKPVALTSTSNLRYRVASGSTLYLNDTTMVPYGGSAPGSFRVDAGAKLVSGHPNGVNGNLAPQAGAPAPELSTGADYEFNGGSAQLAGGWLPSAVNNLTINNALGVSLSGNVLVNGTLALGGKLTTGDNVVGIGTSGSMSGVDDTKYIVGNLMKTMSSGADTKTFEIGDATWYTPVVISGTSYAAPFEATVKTTAGDHPDTLHSLVLAAKSVNRYYTITGTPTGPSDVTFNFLAGDIDLGADPSVFVVGQNDTTNWAMAAVTGRTGTSTTASITHFSDFVVGEANAFTVTVNTVGQGTVTKNPDQSSYTYGSSVQLTAVPQDLSWKFSGWSGDTSGSVNPLIVIVNGETNFTATFVRDSSYLTSYRTFSHRAIGFDVDNKGKQKKFVALKPDKDQFEVRMRVDSTNITGLHVDFGASIDTFMTFTTLPPSTGTSIDGKLKKWDFTFAQPLTTGDSVRIYGYAWTKKDVKVSGFWWTRSGAMVGKKSKLYLLANSVLRLPMPNRINALALTLNSALPGSFGTSGIIVGCNEKTPMDSSKYYGWFQTPKYSDVLKTLNEKSVGQPVSGAARPFDFYTKDGKPMKGQKKAMPPSLENNSLLANLIALKVNIVGSDMGILPPGLGDLIYAATGESEQFDGMTLREIAQLGDSMVMGWLKDSVDSRNKPIKLHKFDYSFDFTALDSVMALVDSAFEGPLDTVSFSNALAFTGTKSLVDVPFLRANPGVVRPKVTPPSSIAEFDLPVAYKVYQNYPNPFNPSTTIEFDLPSASIVTLKVYNILGQEVASLFDNIQMDEGTQVVPFNAGNLATGVYFYRLAAQPLDAGQEDGITEGFTRVMKMMLMK